jgi:Na+/melibiose symporter-like transporter
VKVRRIHPLFALAETMFTRSRCLATVAFVLEIPTFLCAACFMLAAQWMEVHPVATYICIATVFICLLGVMALMWYMQSAKKMFQKRHLVWTRELPGGKRSMPKSDSALNRSGSVKELIKIGDKIVGNSSGSRHDDGDIDKAPSGSVRRSILSMRSSSEPPLSVI